MRRIDFWFDFASTYSYLTIQRIEGAAAGAGVSVAWRPFLLGPVFAAQGWNTSPFNLYPAKGRFMVRDIERRAAALGLPFTMAATMPARSVDAARLAIAALETPGGPAFCRAVSSAGFSEGRDIAEPAVLADAARAAGLDPEALTAQAASPELRPRLRANTETAMRIGVFGAPSFTVGPEDGAPELFWGDDQLEAALAWTARSV